MGLISWAKNRGTGYITGRALRAMGEGKFPVFPDQMQWLYWHTDGLATNFGAVLDFAAIVIEGGERTGLCATLNIPCDGWLETVKHASAMVGTFFIYLGQVRGGLHLEPPTVPPQFWRTAKMSLIKR